MTNWHIVTCEYPPQIGGVSDYTLLLGRELLSAGDDVHIWTSTFEASTEPNVYRVLGDFSPRHLREADSLLSKFPQPRVLLLQWVPHGFGRRGMNLSFTRWIASRIQRGDRLYLMIHEPYLEPGQRSWKHRIVSLAQRRMIRQLLRVTDRAFISIPAWENYLRPYASLPLRFEWLPIPATIDVAPDTPAVKAIRSRFPGDALILGHLGTYSVEFRRILEPALLRTLEHVPNVHALLLGNNSDRFASELQAGSPSIAHRIQGTGALSDSELSVHISACDLALQPYIDGLSSRRTSLMNVISHRVPVVSNIGHLTEPLWSGSHAVALAATTEAGELARLCRELLSDPPRRKNYAEAGRDFYAAHFDWPNIISTLRSASTAEHAAGITS